MQKPSAEQEQAVPARSEPALSPELPARERPELRALRPEQQPELRHQPGPQAPRHQPEQQRHPPGRSPKPEAAREAERFRCPAYAGKRSGSRDPAGR